MLSVAEIREKLGDMGCLSDSEIQGLLDQFYPLAEIVFSLPPPESGEQRTPLNRPALGDKST